jgi:ABC-type sugar transport system substrate-binding protein
MTQEVWRKIFISQFFTDINFIFIECYVLTIFYKIKYREEKMKKRIVVLVVCVALLAALFTACSQQQQQEEESVAVSQSETAETPAEPSESEGDQSVETAGGEPLHIAVSVDGNNAYRHTWTALFQEQAEERGYTVDIANADSDANKQIADTEALLARNPDVFVMMAYSHDGAVPAVEAIKAAGVPVVLYDFSVGTDNYDTFLSVGTEPAGRQSGEYLKEWLEADPSRTNNIGYLVGDYAMETAMPRLWSMQEAFPEMNILAEAQANWTAADAVKYTEDWLQAYPEMNIFACQNDEMAIGVIQALTAAGKIDDPNILVMGYDGIEAAMEYVEDGYMVTSARNIPLEAETVLDTCEKLAHGEEVPKEIVDFSDPVMVTKDNVEEYKETMGFN